MSQATQARVIWLYPEAGDPNAGDWFWTDNIAAQDPDDVVGAIEYVRADSIQATQEAEAEIARLRGCICAIREAADNEDSDAFTMALHDAYAEVQMSALKQAGFKITAQGSGDDG